MEASWRPLGASWSHLKASWRPLGASEGHLGGVLRHLRGVWRRFEASSRPPGWGRAGITTAVAVLGGSLESSKRISCADPRMLRGKIDLGGSWRRLEGLLGILEASEASGRPLGAS